jgi:DNA-directed RNA polymerase specialized sigma24 family protein
MMEEQHARLLASLRDETLRQVAVHRMEGYSNQEIAEALNISLRSVERKLRLIRNEWSHEVDS